MDAVQVSWAAAAVRQRRGDGGGDRPAGWAGFGVGRADCDALVESERGEPVAERAEWVEPVQGARGELGVDVDGAVRVVCDRVHLGVFAGGR
jgi:hypothetical protein